MSSKKVMKINKKPIHFQMWNSSFSLNQILKIHCNSVYTQLFNEFRVARKEYDNIRKRKRSEKFFFMISFFKNFFIIGWRKIVFTNVCDECMRYCIIAAIKWTPFGSEFCKLRWKKLFFLNFLEIKSPFQVVSEWVFRCHQIGSRDLTRRPTENITWIQSR